MFSSVCRKTKTQVITLANHSRKQNSKQLHVTGAKRGKTRACKTRSVLVLHLIGWESGASFVNHSQSVVMQNQSKREITFDTQLKSALTFSIQWNNTVLKSHGNCKFSSYAELNTSWENM